MFRIDTYFPMLGSSLGKVDGRNPSATKKGPGRKHSQGHKKSRGKGVNTGHMAAMAQAAMMAQMMGSQTDHVSNVPLKSATRGG